jgi:DNA-binding CsgD family transcriptional regulator
MCENEVKPTSNDISYVDIVAGLVSLHVSKQQNRNIQLEERGAYLTKRQITIIDMMGRQMTNMQIARELGYSESTVRHETMRIYETLQANGRREAVALARKLGLVK